MGDGTAIEWTDATWNPIRGCSRVSEGCRHCYAETIAARFSGAGEPYDGLAVFVPLRDGTREARWTGDVRLIEKHLTLPLRWSRPRRVFVNSMSDLFHEKVPDDWIDRIFAVMALRPQHQFQVLTKRPERMRAYCRSLGRHHETDRVSIAMKALDAELDLGGGGAWYSSTPSGWAFENIWLGVSIEDQATAELRIPILLETPAAVRFVSAEPLLGPVDLVAAGAVPYVHHHPDNRIDRPDTAAALGAVVRAAIKHQGGRLVDWVIVGGESGPKARPMHPAWARALRDQCAAAGVPFFFKQWGEWTPEYPVPRSGGFTDVRGDNVNDIYWPDGSIGAGRYDRNGGAGQRLVRLGKSKAGRLLDGKPHDAFPTQAPSPTAGRASSGGGRAPGEEEANLA